MSALLVYLALFASVLFLAVLWYNKKTNKVLQFFNRVPSFPGWPIVGNALQIKTTEEILPLLMFGIEQCGKNFKIQLGPIYRFVVTDYKLLEIIFSSGELAEKSDDYDFLLPWLGTGLLTSGGRKWKSHRKIITPTFHFKILEDFIDIFDANSDIMIEKLKSIEDKRSVNVFSFISLCALDIICESAMGVKINAQIDEKSEYVKSVKNMCRILVTRTMSPLKYFDIFYQFTDDYEVEKRSLKYLHDFTYSVIHKNKDILNKQTTDKKEEDIGIKTRKAFLEMLLETTCDGKPLTLEEIREEVDTFIFEGHDTTSAAMTFALYCLANNPEVQKKAYEEQINLFKNNSNSKLTYNDLKNMRYLELVIKETLRLYPSVAIYGRKICNDFEYEGQIVPKGTNLWIFAYGVMRDPDYFPDPERFYPERFETVDGKLPFAYIPFSAGPRNCIGQKFALLEMKSTLSKVLRNFEILPPSPEHKLELACETILCSKSGVKLGLRPRK